MKAIRLTFVLLIVLSILLACGCTVNHPYPFDQSFDNIEKVSLHRVEGSDPNGWYAETTWVEDIELESAKGMLAELQTLKIKTILGDGTRSYGFFLIFITYKDGTSEVVGHARSASIKDEDDHWIQKVFVFESDEWFSIISKYVETDLSDFSWRKDYAEWMDNVYKGDSL